MTHLQTYISLLRGINVTGYKTIKMADLKALYESLRLINVTTYIQSGNVIFQSRNDNPVSVATVIEKAVGKAFGFPVAVILRRPAELRKVVDRFARLHIANKDNAKLHVTFLKERPTSSLVRAMGLIPVKSGDAYEIAGTEVYVHCPNGYGKTQLSNNFFEKRLQTLATTRNWRTVQTLLSMSSEQEHVDI